MEFSNSQLAILALVLLAAIIVTGLDMIDPNL